MPSLHTLRGQFQCDQKATFICGLASIDRQNLWVGEALRDASGYAVDAIHGATSQIVR
jgi:hypothetical protein